MKTMKTVKSLVSLGLVLALSACVAPESASRSAGPDGVTLATQGRLAPMAVGKKVAIALNVTEVVIKVPSSLRVSEAETYYPNADVVWRGEPRGNRLQQVHAIFTEAARLGTGKLKSGLPVVAEVEVTRFHCVTEKTRNSIGGTHSMHFMLTIRHAETGEILDGPREVIADTKASGGSRAIAEDYAGRTQRVVVVERLAQVLQHELKALTVNPAKFGLSVSMSETDPGALVVSSMN
ncbi:MAG: DUF6778 family protein [Paracoccaceae bacterium]